MKEYTIVRRPENLDWSQIPALQINELHNTPPVDITAEARLCYDDEAIYVHLQAVEKNISAQYTGLLDEVSDDSCLEFFFCPMEGDSRYFNIESNPNGAMFLGFGPSVQELCRLIQEEPVIAPRASYTEDGWKVESRRREMLPSPVFWPREFHGLYGPWGHKETRLSNFHFTSLLLFPCVAP